MGISGGRPKKETSGFPKEETSGYSQKKPNENENVNVNVNDNENVNDNVSASCIDGLTEIIDFYNNNIGAITPYGFEILNDYAKEMSKDLIILAMKKAVEANKRNIQYIKAILNNWSKNGIKTVLEAEEETRAFKEKNTKDIETLKNKKEYNNYSQRQYEDYTDFYANIKKESDNK